MIPKYFYGYNIVAAGFIIQAVCIGAMFTYGIFFKEFQAEFGWSRATIAGASSVAFLIMGAGGVLAGRLNDKIGPRVLIIGSGLSLGLGYMLMSRMQSPWQIYLLYGGLAGIGFSTHDVVTLSTVARWFVKRRGMMSGIVKVGTGTGQFVVPLIVSASVTAYGWRNSYLIIGAVLLVALLAVAQVMRRDPEGMGLQPDDARDGARGVGTRDPDSDVTLGAAVMTGQFWIICLSEFATLLCLLTMVVHIVPHGTDIGLPSTTAATVLSTIGGVSMLGRIVMGTANDRIGGKRSLIVCYAVLICALIFLQMANQTWMLLLFAAIYGFAHGGFFTVMSPAVAELFGLRSHGAIFGIVLFSGMIGGAIGPVLTGHFFDVTGSYQTAFIVLIGVAISGLILITLLRPLQGARERR